VVNDNGQPLSPGSGKVLAGGSITLTDDPARSSR